MGHTRSNSARDILKRHDKQREAVSGVSNNSRKLRPRVQSVPQNILSNAVPVESSEGEPSAARNRRGVQNPGKGSSSSTPSSVRWQRQRKLRAPPGFVFVAFGSPSLTSLCKDLSWERSVPIHVAHALPKKSQNSSLTKVSFHLSRVGYYFDADVVDTACRQLGYVLYRGKYMTTVAAKDSRVADYLAEIEVLKGGTRPDPQEDLAVVRAAFQELFPRMPDEDIEAAIDTAWRPGRVGYAKGLPLHDRAQLATLARVRHIYTDYDALLHAFGNWVYARREVEESCAQKLVEWRDVAEGDDGEIREMLRKVIVISDDEDDEEGEIRPRPKRSFSAELRRNAIDYGDPWSKTTTYAEGWPKPDGQRPVALNHHTIQPSAINYPLSVVAQSQSEPVVAVSSDPDGLPPDTIMIDGQVFQREPAAKRHDAPAPLQFYQNHPESRDEQGFGYDYPMADKQAGSTQVAFRTFEPLTVPEQYDMQNSAAPARVYETAYSHDRLAETAQRHNAPEPLTHLDSARNFDTWPGSSGYRQQYEHLVASAPPPPPHSFHVHQNILDNASTEMGGHHSSWNQEQNSQQPIQGYDVYMNTPPVRQVHVPDVPGSLVRPRFVEYPNGELYELRQAVGFPSQQRPFAHQREPEYEIHNQHEVYTNADGPMSFRNQNFRHEASGARGSYLFVRDSNNPPPEARLVHGARAAVQMASRPQVRHTDPAKPVYYTSQPYLPVNGAPHPTQMYRRG